MDKKEISIQLKGYQFVLLVLLAIMPITYLILGFTVNEENMGNYEDRFREKYSVFSLKIPDSLKFAGENVPLDFFDVRESLDRELLVNTYWQSQTLLFVKRANRYFPIIEKILKKNNIPEDFKYLAVAESGLMNVISPSNAVGFWQFLEGTAKDFGLEVNEEIDERYHLEKSTEAACRYLRKNYDTFGSWAMVAASYNAGRRGIIKQVERQKEDNYYNLLLNTETARYVFRIIAIKVILENPSAYGFHLRKQDLYPPLETFEVKLDSSVTDFSDFASTFGINYKMLKYFNPWLRDKSLTNKTNKTYYVQLPQKGTRTAYIQNTK